MADSESIGTLEQESLKRKERLKALKRKHEIPDNAENNSNSENSNSVSLPKPKFRSYRPQDENLKQQIIEDAKPGDVESEIKSHLEAANSKVVIENLDISSLAPRKPDWDLKRDLAKKLEVLERRTHRAIAELIRERLKTEAKEMDLATSVNEYIENTMAGQNTRENTLNESGLSENYALESALNEITENNNLEENNDQKFDGSDAEARSLWEEFEGEEYVPSYVCMKREIPEEEVCESEVSSCTEARTTTGNILDRVITDPKRRRPPCLGKWPVEPPKSVSDMQENNHQHRAALQPTTLAQMCSLRITSKPNPFRQPAIIGTLGPACSSVKCLQELFEAGMNVVRISMSHNDPCSVTESFENVIEANNRFKIAQDYDIPIAIMMHLKGPEIRTGRIDYAHSTVRCRDVYLKEGATVLLTSDKTFENRCMEKIIYIDYDGLAKQIRPGMHIYLSNREIRLVVDAIEKGNVACIVEKGGKLQHNQQVYIPGLPKLLPPISDYDIECLEIGANAGVDVISIPVTRNDAVIQCVKELLGDIQPRNSIKIFASLNNYEGLENIDEILRVADGMVIDRNDLTLEIGPEKMFVAQKEIIAKCNRLGKPVLCIAQLQVKSSDIISQRIEMSDIGGAIVDGADGIILISETALLDQGVKAVTKLSNIIREAEAATMQKPFYFDLVNEQIPSIEPCKAIAMAAVQIANKIHASAILAVTTSGRTAQILSWLRPRCPVIAISRVGSTSRQLQLWRAVIPLHFSAPVLPDWFHDVKVRFEYGIAYGRDHRIIRSGDLLVLVSGFRKRAGFTNSLRIVFASLEKDGFVDDVPHYYEEAKKPNGVNGVQ